MKYLKREVIRTLWPTLQFPPSRMKGVQTRIVRPAKNAHTEYDINIKGPCHVNTITSKSGMYRSTASLARDGFLEVCNGPKRCNTVTSDAARRIPKIARTKLLCQRPCVSQYASSIVVQENAPITAAARIVHYYRIVRSGVWLTQRGRSY